MAIKRLRAWGKQFDIIYVDPPYFDGLYESILKNIKISDILAENGIIILEVSKHFDIEKFDGYEVYRIKDYKTNKHLFIREVSWVLPYILGGFDPITLGHLDIIETIRFVINW